MPMRDFLKVVNEHEIDRAAADRPDYRHRFGDNFFRNRDSKPFRDERNEAGQGSRNGALRGRDLCVLVASQPAP